MPDPILFEIEMPSHNVYKIVDEGARALIQELLNFHEYLGVTTTPLVEGDTTNPITIDGESVTATSGDVVTLSSDHSEMVYNSLGKWDKFGNLSGLGALAFKDSASGSVTAAGSVSAPTFTGQETTSTGKFTPQGSVAAPAFTGQETTSTGKFTPQGSISGITGGTKTVKQFKTQGVMPSFTVSNGRLVITDGTLPTGEDVSVGDGTITSQGSFSGTEGDVTVKGTPLGSNSTPAFTGTEGDVTVKGTPLGSNSQPTFTGSSVPVTVS